MGRFFKFINAREKLMKGIFFLSAVFSVGALITITVFLFTSGIPLISKVGFSDFIFGKEWAPLADNPKYGIFPMIVTSLYVTALSVIIGVTIGLFTAIALYKFVPKKLVAPIKQMVNLLAGIPSVIYGLFGMTLIVPFMRDYVSNNGVGYGIASASVVLAIMILPTIVSVAYDALRSVDTAYYENALGARRDERTSDLQGCLAGGKKRNICRNRIVDRARSRRNDGGNYGYRRQPRNAEKHFPECAYNDRQYRDGRNGTFGRRVERAYRNGRGTLCFHLNAQYKFFPA